MGFEPTITRCFGLSLTLTLTLNCTKCDKMKWGG